VSRCEECGFDWDTPAEELEAAARGFADRYPKPLSRFLKEEDPEVVLRTRPEPGVWSALEYVAHTRDVFDFYTDRIRRVTTEDRPQLTAVGFDALAEERRYNDEDIAAVTAGITRAANGFADVLAGLSADDWPRVGIGSEGDERTVTELARRGVHDAHHHLLDIGRVMRHVRQAAD
jgi:hypothetical protein